MPDIPISLLTPADAATFRKVATDMDRSGAKILWDSCTKIVHELPVGPTSESPPIGPDFLVAVINGLDRPLQAASVLPDKKHGIGEVWGGPPDGKIPGLRSGNRSMGIWEIRRLPGSLKGSYGMILFESIENVIPTVAIEYAQPYLEKSSSRNEVYFEVSLGVSHNDAYKDSHSHDHHQDCEKTFSGQESVAAGTKGYPQGYSVIYSAASYSFNEPDTAICVIVIEPGVAK